MKLFGNTRIYGVKLVDIERNLDYSISATVRDLYDTLIESGDKVKIYLLSPGGSTMSDSFVEVNSISKIEDYDGPVYKFTDILGGINEEVTGNDSSIYCSGDTNIGVIDGVMPVEILRLSKHYKVDKLEVSNPDMYSISIKSDGSIIRTSVEINGIRVMMYNCDRKDNKRRFRKPINLNSD